MDTRRTPETLKHGGMEAAENLICRRSFVTLNIHGTKITVKLCHAERLLEQPRDARESRSIPGYFFTSASGSSFSLAATTLSPRASPAPPANYSSPGCLASASQHVFDKLMGSSAASWINRPEACSCCPAARPLRHCGRTISGGVKPPAPAVPSRARLSRPSQWKFPSSADWPAPPA